MESELSLEQIKELMSALRDLGLTRLTLKRGETELSLAREESQVCHKPPPKHAGPAPKPEAAPPCPTTGTGEYIVSPMVGAFYAAPSPDDDAFVKVGDQVNESTVVCIIEAMKVMNEVKAGKSGKIKAILVDNGSPVEFGTKLFEID